MQVLGEILQEVSLGVVVQGDDDAAAAEAKVSSLPSRWPSVCIR
jgi:hypothetical protein